jgi:hypothetical protein
MLDIRRSRPALFIPYLYTVSFALLMMVIGERRTYAADNNKPQLTAEQATAYERLRGKFSLEGVAKDRYEVTYDDVLGLCQPLTQRMTLQAKNQRGIVFLHPDLSLTLGNEGASYAIGFALGRPAQLPKIGAPVESLQDGYLPIVTSRLRVGDLAVEQLAFCFLPDADAVVTGTEKQDLIVRVSVTNKGSAPAASTLVLLPGIAHAASLMDLDIVHTMRPSGAGNKKKCRPTERRA